MIKIIALSICIGFDFASILYVDSKVLKIWFAVALVLCLIGLMDML